MNKVFLLVLAALVLVVNCSGCSDYGKAIEEKISAAEDIETSSLLILSGESRFEKINLENSEYSSSKALLEASKVDYEEALKILNNATTSSEEEKQLIGNYKTLAIVGQEKVSFNQNMIVCLEHMEKSAAYIYSEDVESMRKELEISEEALNNSYYFLNSAINNIRSIEPETVPIEMKSGIILVRKDLEQSEKMYLELQEMMAAYNKSIDAMEHFFKAGDYIENERWDKAAREIGKSETDLKECNERMEGLKESEFPEISIGAIEFSGVLKQMEEALPHIEAGCTYMDEGYYYKAEKEFNKAMGNLYSVN